ncbi:MAG: universal stress protein [Actinomycetota bacterium]
MTGTPRFSRVMAVVDLGARGREVARQAWNLARQHGARLCLGHVADWGAELGADGFSPLTPPEVEQRLHEVVRRKLAAMAGELGAADQAVSTVVAFPGIDRGIAELLRGWQPDLVVADSRAGIDIDDGRIEVPGWSCTAVTVQVMRSWPAGLRDLLDTLHPARPAPRIG